MNRRPTIFESSNILKKSGWFRTKTAGREIRKKYDPHNGIDNLVGKGAFGSVYAFKPLHRKQMAKRWLLKSCKRKR